MRMRIAVLLFLIVAAPFVFGACSGSTAPGDPVEPAFQAQAFSAGSSRITNAYFPLAPNVTHLYLIRAGEEFETVVVEILPTTRTVAGVACAVVRDRVYVDDLLIEDTHDWFAQDDEGNVWYMGEEVDNFEYDDEGNLISTDHEGAWETGVDGAEAGIVMWSSPVVGHSYRQEYLEGEAEDMGLVVAIGVTLELSDGTTYPDCVRTLDWVPLDPAAVEYKYYSPGLGVVVEEKANGDERVELVAGP